LPTDAWPNWVLGNHDQPRIASRIGAAQARVAQMLLLTLRGTPTCYYGDEIGMHNVSIPPELARDPQVNLAPERGRDPYRTPMQWDATTHAGFSNVAPWLPVADDFATNNVTAQQADPQSMLSLFRRLIEIRRELPALTIGSHRSLDVAADVLAYVREHAGQRVLVLLNFGQQSHHLDLSSVGGQAEVLCSTQMDRHEQNDLAQLLLRPDEGLVLLVQP
jgi:alpha-glucosidase